MKKTLATILLLSTVFVVSCKDDEPEAAPEHGTPSIRYQVKGTVTDEAGKPLKGIAMRVKDDFMNPALKDPYVELYSVETDEKGEYATEFIDDTGIRDGLVLIAEDVDGKENGGLFAPDTLRLIDLEKKKVGEGDDEWDSGIWELKGDVRLRLMSGLRPNEQ